MAKTHEHSEKIGAHGARLDAHDEVLREIKAQLAWGLRGIVILWITMISMGFVSADPSSPLLAFLKK